MWWHFFLTYYWWVVLAKLVELWEKSKKICGRIEQSCKRVKKWDLKSSEEKNKKKENFLHWNSRNRDDVIVAWMSYIVIATGHNTVVVKTFSNTFFGTLNIKKVDAFLGFLILERKWRSRAFMVDFGEQRIHWRAYFPLIMMYYSYQLMVIVNCTMSS